MELVSPSFSLRRARHSNVIETNGYERYINLLSRQLKRSQNLHNKEAAELVRKMEQMKQTTGYYDTTEAAALSIIDCEKGDGGEWGRYFLYGKQVTPRRVSFSSATRPSTSFSFNSSMTPMRRNSVPSTPRDISTPSTIFSSRYSFADKRSSASPSSLLKLDTASSSPQVHGFLSNMNSASSLQAKRKTSLSSEGGNDDKLKGSSYNFATVIIRKDGGDPLSDKKRVRRHSHMSLEDCSDLTTVES